MGASHFKREASSAEDIRELGDYLPLLVEKNDGRRGCGLSTPCSSVCQFGDADRNPEITSPQDGDAWNVRRQQNGVALLTEAGGIPFCIESDAVPKKSDRLIVDPNPKHGHLGVRSIFGRVLHHDPTRTDERLVICFLIGNADPGAIKDNGDVWIFEGVDRNGRKG